MTDERSDNNISSANNSNDLTDERSDTNVPTANNPNDCGQDIAPDSTQKIGKCLDEQVSSRRRSSRDVNVRYWLLDIETTCGFGENTTPNIYEFLSRFSYAQFFENNSSSS